MIVRKQAYCYISSTEDDRVLLFLRKINNELPQWSLLHVVFDYNENNKQSFAHNLTQSINEKVLLGIETMAAVDVSKSGSLWVKILCNNTEYQTRDDYCDETFCFDHEYIKRLRINQNLQEFLSSYPKQNQWQQRFDQYVDTKQPL